MFFRRRRLSLVELVLAFLGLGWLCRRYQTRAGSSDEFRSKAEQFRTKIKDAFSVWEQGEQEAAAPGPEAADGQA